MVASQRFLHPRQTSFAAGSGPGLYRFAGRTREFVAEVAEVVRAAFGGDNRGAVGPGKIMAGGLVVAALQFRDPIAAFVPMKTNNLALGHTI